MASCVGISHCAKSEHQIHSTKLLKYIRTKFIVKIFLAHVLCTMSIRDITMYHDVIGFIHKIPVYGKYILRYEHISRNIMVTWIFRALDLGLDLEPYSPGASRSRVNLSF